MRGEATNATFRHMISIAPLAEVFALVKGTQAAPPIDPAAKKMAIGVRATASTKIRAWAYLPDPQAGQTPFSVRRFVERGEGDAWLFLTSGKDQHAFLKAAAVPVVRPGGGVDPGPSTGSKTVLLGGNGRVREPPGVACPHARRRVMPAEVLDTALFQRFVPSPRTCHGPQRWRVCIISPERSALRSRR